MNRFYVLISEQLTTWYQLASVDIICNNNCNTFDCNVTYLWHRISTSKGVSKYKF